MKRNIIIALLGASSLAAAVCYFVSKTNYTSLSVHNATTADTTVYVSFGADSKITADSWSFCNGSGLTCNFDLSANSSRILPNANGDYINATFGFGAPVACGTTKAEVNINNPTWYDILDVSLVDGYSSNLQITATPTQGNAVVLGPTKSQIGNEKVYGVFPYGCDICVDRQNPPCGITKGKIGCKKGSQYDPEVPCQFQGPTKGGGGQSVQVALVD